ncbi:MAG TPA: DUF6084 family protein [Caulobacteraceae bacterium]|jgi:hypothetical protein|nr:DUF6084 family protein [Caulobacteraceae bacterium]
MPDLDFSIEGVEIERFAMAPTLLFALRIASRGEPVRNIALSCQVRIEPARRGYEAGDHERLSELFGEKQRWGQTLRGFLWDHVNVPTPAFEGSCVVKLPLACSHDFNIAATKYFHGLRSGDAPLSFLFSGAVFYDGADGALQIGQIPWSKDASFALPVATWRELMARHYPDTTWLRVPNDLFERLGRYKRERGFTDWGAALDSLIPASGEARAQ